MKINNKIIMDKLVVNTACLNNDNNFTSFD